MIGLVDLDVDSDLELTISEALEIRVNSEMDNLHMEIDVSDEIEADDTDGREIMVVDWSDILNGDVALPVQDPIAEDPIVQAPLPPPPAAPIVVPVPLQLPVLLPPATILIYGHSFVRRLNTFLIHKRGNYHNMGLTYEIGDTHWYGLGGLTIEKALNYHLNIIHVLQPQVIFIELGSNDLCHTQETPWSCYLRMVNLVNFLINIGIPEIYIGQVVPRQGVGIPLSVRNYNDKVMQFNQLLNHTYGLGGNNGSARYWRHRGLWCSSCGTISRDGIHLNKRGQERLYRSIRGATLMGLRILGYPV